MESMMMGDGTMMVGMAIVFALAVAVLVLVAAAAIKYLFFDRKNRE